MKLLSLTVAQFRSHRDSVCTFTEPFVMFLGGNGTGKTNLLEAIGMLSIAKSVLGVDDDTLRTWDTEFYRVRGVAVSDSGEEKTLEVVSQIAPRVQKACFLNDVRVSASQFVGSLPTVTFLPRDLDLFTGPPAERRRFLDQLLCQVSPPYLQALGTYQQALKQRNALLKKINFTGGPMEELGPWDRALAASGAVITSLRLELMKTFGLSLTAEAQSLGESWSEVRVAYERSGTAMTIPNIEREAMEIFAKNASKDVLLQSTTSGPHREDWTLLVDGHRIGETASRGQQRVGLLALLFLQASYLELRTGERPIILLDDVCSELDDRHQERLLQSFSGNQVFMTGVHIPSLAPEELQIVQLGEREEIKAKSERAAF